MWMAWVTISRMLSGVADSTEPADALMDVVDGVAGSDGAEAAGEALAGGGS